MAAERILLIVEPQSSALLGDNILSPAGFQVRTAADLPTAEHLLSEFQPTLVFLSDVLQAENMLPFAVRLMRHAPTLPVILLGGAPSGSQALDAMRTGFFDYLTPPYRPPEVLNAVRRAAEHRQRLDSWCSARTSPDTQSLQQRLQGLEALQEIGRKVTSLLDLDSILTAVVDAAVSLTQAEEGSLLLLDEPSGELYVRAERNFQENFTRTFRLAIQDSLAGQVLKTGRPVLIDEQTPQKIKTSYLVYTLAYVPLLVKGQAIGVLEVDNRQTHQSFTESQVALLAALADYAAIAIENARLYANREIERAKLETILTRIEEGVIVLDPAGRILLMNQNARQAFNLGDQDPCGQPLPELIRHAELLEMIGRGRNGQPYRFEVELDDGRILHAQLTPIPGVGLAVTMQDITHLKELDRIKTEFVTTVSHDLRSPLTAILGYVELIERVGPVNRQQAEYIRRVQMNVNSITALINDLLDLGRIEAGFDTRKERVQLSALIKFTIEEMRSQVEARQQKLLVDLPDELPPVFGNPVQLRQVCSNLIGNAIKFSPAGGSLKVQLQADGEQIILQVSDNGPGIPPAEQPYIFDKFFRASNISGTTSGSGLGLAIVKSIVESHQGRIWVDSYLGKGTQFSVVLPSIQ